MVDVINKRPGVLFVDDEANALKVFRRAFERDFQVFTASSVDAGLKVLESEAQTISVVISDQRMPQRSGIAMLSEVRRLYPEKIRLLTTAYTQVDTLVDAINEGAVYSFISKPWDLNNLRKEILSAIESYSTACEQQSLLTGRIEELKQAVLDEKIMEIGNVAVNLSHYVDNALCPIELLISKIEDDLVQDSKTLTKSEDRATYLDFLKRIRVHIHSTSTQIARLHQANSPLVPDSFSRIDLVEVLQQAMTANQVLMNGKNIRIEHQIGPETCHIWGDRERLVDLFNFLLAEEVVSLPESSSASIDISQLPGQDAISITLEDRGPVPNQVAPSHLLYPFNVRSGDPRQMGVFLICAYLIVRSHGGSMHSSLREGGGVRFTFELPINQPDRSDIKLRSGIAN
ncbi:response regulator [Coraliomargarita sp. SDUM461004]|uniref:Response regulator n=1 Tax=Thalassobacterium sedimentorum TaxID=3041258 RepID=A0ABU1AHM4_9BACT|nr:response regulator [Coraliomargarita sp. SDUM461004]MDQ8194089.1 response regulator [Coraliomargarita sp. SDUM461004]